MPGGMAHKTKVHLNLRRSLLLLICAFLLYFLIFIGVVHMFGTVDATKEADAIVVLGAGLLRDGRPGWSLTRRSRHAADLWRAGIAPTVICTGGKAEAFPRSEADACRELLQSSQVPAGAILLEEQSRSTEENAIYSRRIIDRLGFEDIVLVSDSYHMLRANWLFQLQGIRSYRSPVPARRIGSPLAYPSALIREFLAFNWQLVKETFQIPVTHLKGI